MMQDEIFVFEFQTLIQVDDKIKEFATQKCNNDIELALITAKNNINDVKLQDMIYDLFIDAINDLS